MGNTVGTDGLTAIRDFVKPYVIGYSDISNTSEIYNLWDLNMSALVFGHCSSHYQWNIDSTKLTTALKWNFWEVTEYDGQSAPVVLHRTADNCYEGIRRNTGNTYDKYHYIVQVDVNSGYCHVWVYGICTPYDADGNADVVFNLTDIFSFETSELTYLFGQFLSGNSFIFTKTQSNITVNIGENMETIYILVPLDTTGTSQGCMRLQYIGPVMNYNSGGSLSTGSLVWKGESYFFNKHQIWVFSLGFGTDQHQSLTLINSQDVAIQTLSASDYANLSTKDSNTLYFVPEE